MATFGDTQKVNHVTLDNVAKLLRLTVNNHLLIELGEKSPKIKEALSELTKLLTGHRKPSLNISLKLWLKVPKNQMPKLDLGEKTGTISAKGSFDFNTDDSQSTLKITSDDTSIEILIASLPPCLFIKWQKHLKLDFYMDTIV